MTPRLGRYKLRRIAAQPSNDTIPGMEHSRKLIERASQGDAVALGRLLEQNLPELRGYVRLQMGARMRAKESASDVVQSACREVLEHLDRYQYQGEENFRRWLFTTALRKVRRKYEYYRADKRDMQREIVRGQSTDRSLHDVYAVLATPSAEMIAKEGTEAFEEAFANLSEDYREVIMQARILGMSHKEIAEASGRSEAACRMLLRRALVQLAGILEPDNE